MYKYLFSDIDGTLLQQGTFNTETINKIHNFINEGNHFFLATGRIDSDIIEIQKHLNINPKFRVSQNGAIITKADNTVISEIAIPTNDIEPLTDYIFKAIKDKKIVLEASLGSVRYATKTRPTSINHSFTTAVTYDKKLQQRILQSSNLILFLLLSEDESYFIEIINYIHKNFPNLQAIKTSEGCLEILNKDATKGNAIEFILKKLTVTDKNKVFVVGDSYNDISMFDKFENSFVMSTSPIDIEKHANYRANVVGEVLDFINNLKVQP